MLSIDQALKTQVASKKLGDGAWILLESAVVWWPLTQQGGAPAEISEGFGYVLDSVTRHRSTC